MTTLAIVAIIAAFVAGVVLGDRVRALIEAKKAQAVTKIQDAATKL